jgi:hypothetical protein
MRLGRLRWTNHTNHPPPPLTRQGAAASVSGCVEPHLAKGVKSARHDPDNPLGTMSESCNMDERRFVTKVTNLDFSLVYTLLHGTDHFPPCGYGTAVEDTRNHCE